MERILVADDNEAMGRYLVAQLSTPQFNFHVDWVRDVETAKATMRFGEPDCLLLDLHFPGGAPGKAIVASFHAEFPNVPIFVLAGAIDGDPTKWGADDSLPKGQLSIWHLANSLRSCIGRKMFQRHRAGLLSLADISAAKVDEVRRASIPPEGIAGPKQISCTAPSARTGWDE